MAIKYTVYVSIEATDESLINTSKDDSWHPSLDVDLEVFDTLEEAEAFVGQLQGIR